MAKIRIAVYPPPDDDLPFIVAAFAPGLDTPEILVCETMDEARALAEAMSSELEKRVADLSDEDEEPDPDDDDFGDNGKPH